MESIPHCPQRSSAANVLDDAFNFLTASPLYIDVATIDLIEALAIELSGQRDLVDSLKQIVSASLERLQSQDPAIDVLREEKQRLIAELRVAIGDVAA